MKRFLFCAAMTLPVAVRAYTFNASDFATSVISDSVTPANSSNALGRPSVDTDGSTIGSSWAVVPVYQPFASGQLTTLNAGQSLTVKFDHKVLDDPNNPYGKDFTIFGNANWQISGSGASAFWQNGDPNSTTLSSSIFSEPGTVSVSQDGVNWFSFSSGPSADDFAPTLGRNYLGNNSSGSFWGDATDPTLPLNPNITLASYAGKTLAALASAYGNSAGGTSFDIASLNLLLDPSSGEKWIQYVRISNSIDSEVTPDIDAIADVAAVPEPVICIELPLLGAMMLRKRK